MNSIARQPLVKQTPSLKTNHIFMCQEVLFSTNLLEEVCTNSSYPVVGQWGSCHSSLDPKSSSKCCACEIDLYITPFSLIPFFFSLLSPLGFCLCPSFLSPCSLFLVFFFWDGSLVQCNIQRSWFVLASEMRTHSSGQPSLGSGLNS